MQALDVLLIEPSDRQARHVFLRAQGTELPNVPTRADAPGFTVQADDAVFVVVLDGELEL